MIPLRDENPPRNPPVVTYLLIAVNVVVFVWQIVAPQQEVAGYLMIPAEITSGRDLPPVYSIHPLYLTIFTAMFMHAGFLHIAGNMLYLWIFGDNVEDMLGPVKYLIFYLACGLAAAIAQIALMPDSTVPTLGASGAIAGVLGAYLVTYGSAKVLCVVTLFIFWQFIWLPAWLVLGAWFVLQLFSLPGSLSQGGGVAYMAHVGGFITGAILVYVLGGGAHKRAPVSRDGWGYRG